MSGVEATTGPLGQGIATSVGMAMAQKWLATRYNQPGFAIFDYRIYASCGDGCLMEGVGAEAASLAGHLGLDNLCWLYDNNHITIEGNTRIAFTEDVAARFLGYQWNVLRVGDVNDLDRIGQALDRLHEAAARSDGAAYFALFAPQAVFIGTDATERWPLADFRAYAEPYFASGKGWVYHPRTRTVTLTTLPCVCSTSSRMPPMSLPKNSIRNGRSAFAG